MIYYTLLPQKLISSDYEKIYADIAPFLPGFRQKKAECIIPAKERAVSVLSFVLLCHALSKEYHDRFYAKDTAAVCNFPEFSYAPNGKPSLPVPYSDIHFNISHCHTAIACALAPFEVGVDVQDIRHTSLAISKRIPFEMDDMEFSKFWSRYEAYTKLTGEGITKSFETCDFMSENFLKNENVSIITSPVLSVEPDIIASDNAQKKTAAFLSAAFYKNSCGSNILPKEYSEFSDNLISVELSSLCSAVLL